MNQVRYDTENVSKCWCGQCPVQAESACAKQEYEEAKPDIEAGHMPAPNDVPGLYCGTGTATCGGLKSKERCLCPECLVWGENNLLSNHYCVQGAADEVAH